ncbi:hypothetical protein HK101_004052 [Irineochytrium annulatum]|nr:hypothetical protein HK101_004052 [Irineochytrium annulatum]
MRGLYKIGEEKTDDEVFTLHFRREVVIERVAEYLTALVSSSVAKGMIGEMIKAGSLCQRAEAMWHYAIWEFPNGLEGLYQEWCVRLCSKIQELAVTCGLETGRRERNFFGEPELRLLFDHIFNKTERVDWFKQHYVAWVMSFMCGIRPGTITYSKGCHPADRPGAAVNTKGDDMVDQTLTWNDIEFRRIRESESGVKVTINFLWLKGEWNLHSSSANRFRGITFTMEHPRNPDKEFLDLSLLLLLLAIDRGVIAGPPEDALRSSKAVLRMDPRKTRLPVFVSQKGSNTEELSEKGMLAYSLNPTLQEACRAVGLTALATMYAFRREFITAIGQEKSIETAKQFAGHISSKNVSYAYYDYGLADQDLTKARLDPHEEAAERMRRRQERSAPAVVRRANQPDEEKRTEYIDMAMLDSDEVQSWEEAFGEVCTALKNRFKFPPQSTMKSVTDYLCASTVEWKSPNEEDDDDPQTWVAWCSEIKDRGGAGGFFKAVALRRKTVLKRNRRKFGREFDRLWREEGHFQSVENLQEMAMKPPTLFTRPTGSIRTIAELSARQRIRNGAVGAIARAAESAAGETEMEEAESGLTDTDLEPNNSAGRLYPLESLASGLKGDQRLEVTGDTGNDVASLATGKSESELALLSSEMRAVLINLWTTLGSAYHGPSKCRLCEYDPAGAGGETHSKRFLNAEKMCLHVIRNVHLGDTTFTKFVDDSFDEGQKKYFCLICSDKANGWADKKNFKKHLKSNHVVFVKGMLN